MTNPWCSQLHVHSYSGIQFSTNLHFLYMYRTWTQTASWRWQNIIVSYWIVAVCLRIGTSTDGPLKCPLLGSEVYFFKTAFLIFTHDNTIQYNTIIQYNTFIRLWPALQISIEHRSHDTVYMADKYYYLSKLNDFLRNEPNFIANLLFSVTFFIRVTNFSILGLCQ